MQAFWARNTHPFLHLLWSFYTTKTMMSTKPETVPIWRSSENVFPPCSIYSGDLLACLPSSNPKQLEGCQSYTASGVKKRSFTASGGEKRSFGKTWLIPAGLSSVSVHFWGLQRSHSGCLATASMWLGSPHLLREDACCLCYFGHSHSRFHQT